VSAKKEIELELTRARDRLEDEVARRTRDLQIALDQQTALLHEVDHRVKNSLQVVSSLVLLKARRIPDEGVREVLLNLAERISALATVHRMLYSTGDVSRFNLAEFVAELSGDLVTTRPHGQLELRLNVDPVAVSAAKAAPLALLVNEIVGNAVKHAHPRDRHGCLSVEVTRPGNDVRIVVEDDGVGMDMRGAPEHGFGKTLIELLGRQLRAHVDWEDAEPGTRVVVTMPLNAEEAQL
jgi:two-component sensor histidine kinase